MNETRDKNGYSFNLEKPLMETRLTMVLNVPDFLSTIKFTKKRLNTNVKV